MNYIFLYFFISILIFSIIGYGFLLSRITNKDLLSLNIGYQGLLGILFLTIISYFTIFFLKHDYVHNIIIHFFGILSFGYFIKKEKRFNELKKLFIILTILFVGILIIRNHDDFNYYHLTYSLGLTENKLLLGLGQFQHGYKHHSSLFFFNSIIFLPYIKYYLFHAHGWFILIFVNYYIIDHLLFKNIKKLNFEYYFYLLALLFIDIKFSRVGGYGTDLAAQMILLSLFPLIFTTLKIQNNDQELKKNLSLIILIITLTTTLKSFFILNFLYLFLFFLFFNFKKIINYFILSKVFLISFITIFLLVMINISYTGCAVYPVKQTCLSNQLSWSLEKDHVHKMNNWYQQWSKAGAGINYRTKDPENYIKKFNWVGNWFEKYFLYKGKELVIGIIVINLLLLFLFRGNNKEPPDKRNNLILLSLLLTTMVLFFEWFYNHPAFRYGGYYLLCIICFIPISFFLSKKKLLFIDKKKSIIFLVIFSFFVFHLRNYKRIADEFNVVPNNNFPLFFAPIQTYDEFDLGNDMKVYIPTSEQGCWIIKTPCVSGSDHVFTKKKFGFTIFVPKK